MSTVLMPVRLVERHHSAHADAIHEQIANRRSPPIDRRVHGVIGPPRIAA